MVRSSSCIPPCSSPYSPRTTRGACLEAGAKEKRMLTERENDRLSCVGPGTPMGNVLRRYWHPVATVPDLDREKVLGLRILGEDLALYRSDRGEPGLVQQRCPHRSASLAYGIPDADGIRCPYHGWYFNKAGQCLAQPYDDTENLASTFKDK